jgi:hypothetical protein
MIFSRPTYLIALAGFGFAGASALGQAPTDRVNYHGPDGKVLLVTGETKESASGVSVIGNDKKEIKIPAGNMIRIEYGDGNVPGIDRNAQIVANAADAGTDIPKAIAAYSALLKTSTSPKAKRFAGFREIMLMVKENDQKTGDDFKKNAAALAAKCSTYANEQKASWESWIVARTAARIYDEIGDHKMATAAARILSTSTALSAEMKVEAKYLELAYTFREGDYAAAKLLQADAIKDAVNPGQSDRAKMYEAALKALPAPAMVEGMEPVKPSEAVAAIEKLISDTKDPVARSCGYAILGELYLAYKAPRDAMWSYLWVDAVYNQDKDEQVNAVNRLIEIFELLKEKDRVEQFTDRLPKVRG